MKLIVNNQYSTQLDPCDLATFLKVSWTVKIKSPTRVYVYNNSLGFLHKIIMSGTDEELVVDHINGDTLDNRRSNLRLVTNRVNRQNSAALRTGARSSKYIGVAKASKNSFRARHWSKTSGLVHIGVFPTEEEAAIAYDNYVITTQPMADWGTLNFPAR